MNRDIGLVDKVTAPYAFLAAGEADDDRVAVQEGLQAWRIDALHQAHVPLGLGDDLTR